MSARSFSSRWLATSGPKPRRIRVRSTTTTKAGGHVGRANGDESGHDHPRLRAMTQTVPSVAARAVGRARDEHILLSALVVVVDD